MAGQFIEILNPGYSTLWTRDLEYTVGTGEAATLNPFDPSSARPLVEGEFLELSATAAGAPRVKRGGNNALAASPTMDSEGTNPAYLHFMEQGRYDQQATRRAHIIMGPTGFEFRTKLCNSTGLSVNSKVSVFDWQGPLAAWSYIHRIIGLYNAGWCIGRVSRIYGTNDISVVFLPGSA